MNDSTDKPIDDDQIDALKETILWWLIQARLSGSLDAAIALEAVAADIRKSAKEMGRS